MAQNYVLLETINLTQSASSITFDNIPQSGYTDLKIVYSARDGRAADADDFKITINGNTSATYTNRRLYGTGTSTGSDGGSSTGLANSYSGALTGATLSTPTYSNGEFYFSNYLSGIAKSWYGDGVTEHNSASAFVALNANLINDTNPITSIKLEGYNSSTLYAASTFSLYGVAAVGTTPSIAPKAFGGNIVANDGTYWYHAFISSGTFTPSQNINCEAIIIGGGGGSTNAGGGGGAGGYRTMSSSALTADTGYSVTIGAGGFGGGSNWNIKGGQGTLSSFNSIESAGGGAAGGTGGDLAAIAGGSGGGAGASGAVLLGAAGNTPSTSPAQGYAGGNNLNYGGYCGGGGGGAGGAGVNGTFGQGGNGGAGVAPGSNWASATNTGVSGYYAGGGGGAVYLAGYTGGTGAAGGGSGGSGSGAGSSAIANTGSGGGGGGSTGAGGAGGSGLVIIRYAMA